MSLWRDRLREVQAVCVCVCVCVISEIEDLQGLKSGETIALQ